MKALAEIEIKPLEQNRLLAFHTQVGMATVGDREFTITRDLTGLHLAVHEDYDGGKTRVSHTINLNSVLEVALAAIIKGA